MSLIFNLLTPTIPNTCTHKLFELMLLLRLLFFLLAFPSFSGAQSLAYIKNIDSLLDKSSNCSFNGIIMVTKGADIQYSRMAGFADPVAQTPLTLQHQYVVGSLSKQFTAVLVLREYDAGRLELQVPIRKYLPELTRTWADTVTVHHLLTHTHGIVAVDKPVAFKPGSQYDYSQIGYHLLARIVERTSGKSFPALSRLLFKDCNMQDTYHPDITKYTRLLKGYNRKNGGKPEEDKGALENYPAAGSFISTAGDLVRWNQCLHGGKLLQPATYTLMCTPQKNAVRQHPVFGKTEYGYGLTVGTFDKQVQLGQTGFSPGFASLNFYYPATQTSVVVLSNVLCNPEDLKKVFYYHVSVADMVRKTLGKK
jgi:D-alanyl-D-alanine carboxypeptidase